LASYSRQNKNRSVSCFDRRTPCSKETAPARGPKRQAVEGRLPRGIGVERLRDAPAEWSRQFEALGLNPQ
jgi:hypothetical protein